ncbi:MAG TPA: DUF2249 domain-containing protein [Pyrinomonadaceae bacterium]|nr:DUF2249 domain-containing protein [Pyrinomonadaceae bacterium]
MKVTPELTVKDVLNIDEGMVDAFIWISPAFEQLRNPTLRQAMAERMTVAQAARLGQVPLNEALYVLNLAAGENERRLLCELENSEDRFNYSPENPRRPRELQGLRDNDKHIILVDVVSYVARNEDPRPAIMHGLTELRDYEDVLLVRHAFDPVPLRELFESRGFATWAEERRPGDWYVYFYRPTVLAGAVVQTAEATPAKARAFAAGA